MGTILSWSLVHGGPGGNFMSKSLYNAIAYDAVRKDADPGDLPQGSISAKVEEVQYCQCQSISCRMSSG